MGSALTPAMSVDLGGGSNKLTLANAGNAGTVSNVSTLIGGARPILIVFGGGVVNGSVDIGGGSDTHLLPTSPTA